MLLGLRQVTGQDWVLKFMKTRSVCLGQKCCPKAKTSLHAKAEGIIWALKEAYDRGYNQVFPVKIIRKDEEWHVLAPELDDIKALTAIFRRKCYFLCF